MGVGQASIVCVAAAIRRCEQVSPFGTAGTVIVLLSHVKELGAHTVAAVSVVEFVPVSLGACWSTGGPTAG